MSAKPEKQENGQQQGFDCRQRASEKKDDQGADSKTG
jgi:hypothetical protein